MHKIVSCGALLTVSAFGVGADEIPYTGEPMVVTATRTAAALDTSLAAITVLTRADIERTQSLTLPELLAGISGIDIATSGGRGKQTSVFLRGANSSQTLVLVDGIRVGSATSGTVSWEFLPLAMIERVEIVRGPRSSLYGADAMGGVIQIFTRRGAGPMLFEGSAGYGSHQSREWFSGISGSHDKTSYQASIDYFTTDGVDARQPTEEFGSLLDEPDADGYRNTSFSARFGHQVAANLDLELHALRSQGDTEFDSNGNNEDDFVQEVIGTKLLHSPTAIWDMTLQAGRSRDRRTSARSDNPSGTTRFDTERRVLSWQNDLALRDDQLLILGLDYLDDRVSGTTDFKVDARDNKAAFGQYQGRLGTQDASLGLRVDDNQQFGSHITGNLGWGTDLPGKLRLSAAFGTAFKAPSFNDLYFPDFVDSSTGERIPTSNPDLDPEESHSLELGLSGRQHWGRWSLYAYETHFDNLIALDEDFIPQNIQEARVRGVEVTLQTRVHRWEVLAHLSYVDPRNQDSDNLLTRRAQESLRIDADRSFGAADFGLSLIAQGRRFDDAANEIRLGGYTVVNLRGEYPLGRGWTAQAKIDNLFDKDYHTVASYNALDRTAFISVIYRSR